jgi:7-cyano-7-deazaguanine synthase
MADLVLLSGGIDSTCVAALANDPVCVTIDYGQLPAEGEIRAASAITSVLGVEHEVLKIDCSAIGSGLLAGAEESDLAPSEEWWPFRNQLLVTFASPIALRRQCSQIVVGSVRSDRFHRDGTPEFFDQLDRLTRDQEGGIRVVAPAINVTTDELVLEAHADTALLGWTFSCHRTAIPCGDCPGCNKRRGLLQRIASQ